MPYRIMVVDDDEGIRRIIRATLEPAYEVIEARDGLEAMQRIETHQPDLAIIDLNMPVIGGMELCRGIRRHPEFGAMPVIFLSGDDSRDQIKQSYAAGASLYLVKPIEPGRVTRVVEMTIDTENVPKRAKRHTVRELEEMDRAEAAAAGETDSGHHLPPLERISGPVASPNANLRARVMLVDDEDDILSLLELTLQRDFEVVMARNGLEAIEKIVSYQPDIILLDIMMPKMNGFQLLQTMRRNARFATTPIVIVSAKASERDRQYALRVGATDFIPKPFSPEGLLARVKQITVEPDFRIGPKRLDIREIIEKEYLQNKDKDDPESQKARRRHYSEMESLLNQQAKKEGR